MDPETKVPASFEVVVGCWNLRDVGHLGKVTLYHYAVSFRCGNFPKVYFDINIVQLSFECFQDLFLISF